MEQNLICFFSISNFSHCFLCFRWCVIVNGHLYVNMKKPRSSTDRWTSRNHVGLAFAGEPERFCHDYLLNLLISRLSASLCMVFGSCCISLKMKSWREDSYCVDKKYIYWSFHFFCCFFLQMDISVVGIQTRSTHQGCGFLGHGTAKTRIIPQRLRAKTARRATRRAGDPLASVVELTPDYQG